MAKGVSKDFPKIFIDGKQPIFDCDFKIDPSVFRMKICRGGD